MGGEERFSFLSLDPPPLLFFGSLSILHAAKTQIVPWSFFPRGTGGGGGGAPGDFGGGGGGGGGTPGNFGWGCAARLSKS